MAELFIIFIVLNLISFGIFGYDKFLAKKHRRRVSENLLLISTFFVGTIGALLGMLIFRHKISKKSFLLKFGLIVLVQVLIIYLFKNIFSITN